MGNVFRRFGLLSVTLVLCGACSGAPEDEPNGDGVEAYSGAKDAPGVTTPPNTNPTPNQNTPPVTQQNTETPAVGNNTPLAPTGTPEAPPPAQTPVVTTPPVVTPPPPVVTPPVEPTPEPPVASGVDPNFFIFLLIGQSNMEGVPPAQAQDMTPNPRVKVLALNNCAQRNQVYNQWYTASPSLHTCQSTLGPGDYFGKAMADALPNNTIGLVPAAIAGVDIAFFQKGIVSTRRNEFRIPPDNQKNSAYDMVVERAKLAQKVGVIKGILFHQGESDAANAQPWPGKVKDMLDDLKADLGLPNNLPFLAGELLYPPGCCSGMNTTIAQLPAMIPGAVVVRANGLNAFTGDGAGNLHFDTAGQRTFGGRYATAMLGALGL
jgi:hypothetical protein